MNDSLRDDLRQLFDRQIGPPPPGTPQRVLAGVANPVPKPAMRWQPAAAAVAFLLAAAIVVALLTAREAQRTQPGTKSVSPPAARTEAAVAYDQKAGRLVVFGGTSNYKAPLAETWLWDGRGWSLARGGTAPPARRSAVAAYDPALGVVVFGGGIIQPHLTDTWAWNGSTWRQIAVNAPSFDSVALAYDPSSSTLLAYGDFNVPGSAQTWRWANGGWEQLHPTTQPQGALVFAWDGRHVILSGGQTWAWQGGDWVRLHPSVELPPIYAAPGAFDAATGRIVVLAAIAGGGSETWSWDGSTWSRLHPAHQPESLVGAGAAYDSRLHEVDVFGGGGTGADFTNGLWTWNGTDWSLASGSAQPPPAQPVITAQPSEVATIVSAGSSGIDPRLVPTYAPAGMIARVSVGPGVMMIDYADDTHQRELTIAVEVANPPPVGPNGQQTIIDVRGQRAEYWVYDVTAPRSPRNLTWNEPGTFNDPSSSPSKRQGVPYFAGSTGITEAEFFKVVNSLKRV